MPATHADLIPQRDLADLPARRTASYARTGRKNAVIGNGFFEADIHFDGDAFNHASFVNKLTGETFGLEFRTFRALFEHVEISGEDGKLTHVEARGSAEAASVSAFFSCDWFEAEVAYVAQRGEHVLQKRLVLRNMKLPAYLRRLSLFSHHVNPDNEALLHDCGLYYPVLFYRGQRGGLFFFVDFPCYFVNMEDDTFSFDYYPSRSMHPGRSFQSLTAHIGVCELTGQRRANRYHDKGAALDEGERRWFRHVLKRGYAPAPLPALEMRAPEPGASGPSDLEVLQQCRWFDVKHLLVPRLLQDVESYPGLETMKRLLREQGISLVFVWSRETAEDVRWVRIEAEAGEELPSRQSHFMIEAFRDYLVEQHLTLMEKHQFAEVEVVGPPVVPYSTGGTTRPDAVAVRELLHQAFQGLVDTSAALQENFGRIGSGRAYSSYGAGVAQLFETCALIAEEHPLPLPDMHLGRLYADMGRLYFRRSYDFLMPKAVLQSSVGFPHDERERHAYPGARAHPWYLYHDKTGWRYALLSAIATSVRHRFHPLPMDLPDEEKEFAQKWLRWEQEHLAELAEVEPILDDPGLGTVDGYSYTSAHGSFTFLFNNSYDPRDVTLQLQLEHDSDYIVRELYPREFNYLGPGEGLFRRDSVVSLTLRPREARVLEAVRRSPAAARRKRPEFFGAPGHDTGDGLEVVGRPGERASVGVRVGGRFRMEEVRFPGERADTHITQWHYMQRSHADGRDTLCAGGFGGRPLTSETGPLTDVWLDGRVHVPPENEPHVDTTPFRLSRPAWSWPDRVFFVVRFEPPPVFDPIRTSSEVEGVPEAYWPEQTMKCGIDLASWNLGLKAWVNGTECAVYPAVAAWSRLRPNPAPVVAYFFEAGSKLRFGGRNHVVLFARNFDPGPFRGVYVEHLPELHAEKSLTFS